MGNKIATRLKDLLDLERAALMSGQLTEVATLNEEKEILMKDAAAMSEAELADIRALLDRNGRLLLAAKEGVEGTVQMLLAQRASRQSLNSYSAEGAARQIGSQARQTDRKF